MRHYYQDDLVTLYHGDSSEWVGSADLVLADPPYGIGLDTTRRVGRAKPFGHGGYRRSSDNPPCVRPDHLFLGTQSDNILDAVRKGRHWPSRDQ